jgi:Flp pilus assembly protein TadG
MATAIAATVVRRISNALRVFRAAEEGNVAVIFSLALIPIMGAMGAAVDYSRASTTKSAVQQALDVALLAGAKDGSSSWQSVATNVFKSNLGSKVASLPTPSFGKDSGTVYTGSVSTTVTTSVLGVMGINSVPVSASGKATAADADNSCILTLDQNAASSHVSLSLNGAPVINLSGCSIRSNTSMDCNGHDGSVTKSYASGTATACGKPTSNAPMVPDTYKDLATNISTACGGLRPGVTWTAGVIPTGAAVKTVNKTYYTEYHICGDLTVTGSGYLTGSAPATDSVIIIENGSLYVGDNAVINTARTAIVFTGDNNWPAKMVFPNGNGKTGTLSLSPPTAAGNPWQAVAVYLDPKLTKDVDNKWGPGASFSADGLVYLGNSNVVTDGNTASANSKCTKFVMNGFVTNGSVRLDFAQLNCSAIGLKQWDGIFVHLIK